MRTLTSFSLLVSVFAAPGDLGAEHIRSANKNQVQSCWGQDEDWSHRVPDSDLSLYYSSFLSRGEMNGMNTIMVEDGSTMPGPSFGPPRPAAPDPPPPPALTQEQRDLKANPLGQFGSLAWIFKLMPGMRARLYGRSLTPACKCEACAYVLDTLMMYLDEDTGGWYLPQDVRIVIMDRFCYGIKYLYRSACQHIMSAYMEDVVAMAMGHITGVDICRVLRFCPFYSAAGGNAVYGGPGTLAWLGNGPTGSNPPFVAPPPPHPP